MSTSKEGFVCDEHILFNRYYQPSHMLNETNTYQYQLAMNHRDITKPEDYQYLQRCVERFKELSHSSVPKKYIHITPLTTLEAYNEVGVRELYLEKCKQFNDFICEALTGPISGIIFIMVRSNENECRSELILGCSASGESERDEVRTSGRRPLDLSPKDLIFGCSASGESERDEVRTSGRRPLELSPKDLLHQQSQTGTRIYVIYTNKHFKDAGETFTGNYQREQQCMENIILNSDK